MAFSSWNEPNLGDILAISRESDTKLGLYVGEGNIIHMSDEPAGVSASPKVRVKEEPLSIVAAGGTWRVFNMLDEKYKPRDVEAMVEDAKGLVGAEVPSQLMGKGDGLFLFLRYGFLEQEKEKKEEKKKEEKEKELSSQVGALVANGAGVGATVAKAAIKPLQMVETPVLGEAQKSLPTKEELATARALLLDGKEELNKIMERYVALVTMLVLYAGLYVTMIRKNQKKGRPRKDYERGYEEFRRYQQEGGFKVRRGEKVRRREGEKKRDQPFYVCDDECYSQKRKANEEELEYELLELPAVQALWQH